MTVTVDASTSNEWYSVLAFDVTGFDPDTPLAQAAVANGAAINPAASGQNGTLTLGSNPASGNMVVAMYHAGVNTASAFTAPSGYTALANQNAEYTKAAVFYHEATTTAAVSAGLGNDVGYWGGVIIEIKAEGEEPPPEPTLTQTAVRVFADDDTEGDATPLAAENAAAEVTVGENFRPRFQVGTTGNPAPVTFSLRAQKWDEDLAAWASGRLCQSRPHSTIRASYQSQVQMPGTLWTATASRYFLAAFTPGTTSRMVATPSRRQLLAGRISWPGS
jgi:hypothetical protein